MMRNYIVLKSGEVLHREDIGTNLNQKSNKALIEILAITHGLSTYEVGTEVIFKQKRVITMNNPQIDQLIKNLNQSVTRENRLKDAERNIIVFSQTLCNLEKFILKEGNEND